MKILKITMLFAAVLCLASCGTVSKSSPYSVSSTKLDITMQDLVYLGDANISCEYDTYLGIFRSINKVNGKQYNPEKKNKFFIPANGLISIPNKGMDLAAGKILEQYPDAEYVQVVRQTTEKDILFLGASIKKSARVRVYKFR